MTAKNDLGQYFTTNCLLKEKVLEFIRNDPTEILEPSVGRGDLVSAVLSKNSDILFDLYEIDNTIDFLQEINPEKIIFGDFLTQTITKKYSTIIGNPPYVRTKKGNLYIDFVEKCFSLLEEEGELIFIVPSDFLKLTGASNLLDRMMTEGTFTHIFHPNDEKMFENASIDVIVFRYCKNSTLEKKVLYNDVPLFVTNNNGMIVFNSSENKDVTELQSCFDVYVGLVSGKEEVYKNSCLGNIPVLNGEDKIDKYIYIDRYPCSDERINSHLSKHKTVLIGRGIRKFNETNWFEWGAPRNITAMNTHYGEDCIYIYNLTRKQNIAFFGKVQYFGGGLIMLKPKRNMNLVKILSYLNSSAFKDNFLFSGRFKIGQRQICCSFIPNEFLE